MSKPDKVIPEQCRGYIIDKRTSMYTENDSIIQALGIGCCHYDQLSPDLKQVYENHPEFSALPTQAGIISKGKLGKLLEGLQTCPGMPDFNPMMLLHGEQTTIILHADGLPTSAEINTVTKIVDVLDKKKGALFIIQSDINLVNGNIPLCQNIMKLFFRGIGDFEDNHQSDQKDPLEIPTLGQIDSLEKVPTHTATFTTFVNQAIIQRLSGDNNPLHIDKDMASIGGFDRPILHGMAAFGITGKSIVDILCNGDPKKFKGIACRFTNPIFPGDILQINMWKQGNGKIMLKVFNKNTNKDALVGSALISESSKI